MKPVVFYSVAAVRADLIALQAACLRKFFLDAHELVVVDNSPAGEESLSIAIQAAAAVAGARYARVPASEQNMATANEAHASALRWTWKTLVLPERPLIACLYDMDMFLLAPWSADGWLGDAIVGGREQGRPSGIRYFWPGLMFLRTQQLPEIESVDLWCGRVRDVPVDVGGQFSLYLERHPEVPTKGIAGTSVIEKGMGVDSLPVESRCSYDDAFKCEVFGNAFLHYRAATGWDHPGDDLRERKTKWVKNVVENCLTGRWGMPCA